MSDQPLTESSPAWVELKIEVRELKTGLDSAARTAKRTEAALLGTYDETGAVWKTGIREQVASVYWVLKLVGAIATGVLFTAGADLANSYFGWWGASHAARILTGGH